MVHTKKGKSKQVRLVYKKYKTQGDMKLAVKDFRNGQYKTLNIEQYKDRKLSLIFEMKESRNKYVYAIKAKGSIQHETHLKISIRIFCTTYLKETSNYTI